MQHHLFYFLLSLSLLHEVNFGSDGQDRWTGFWGGVGSGKGIIPGNELGLFVLCPSGLEGGKEGGVVDKVFFMIMSVGRGRREECEEVISSCL